MACITANMARECRVERVDKHQLAGGGQGSAGRRSNSVHVQGKPGGKHSCAKARTVRVCRACFPRRKYARQC